MSLLATPFFRHLARPREAEMTERMKVMKNSMTDNDSRMEPEGLSIASITKIMRVVGTDSRIISCSPMFWS